MENIDTDKSFFYIRKSHLSYWLDSFPVFSDAVQ